MNLSDFFGSSTTTIKAGQPIQVTKTPSVVSQNISSFFNNLFKVGQPIQSPQSPTPSPVGVLSSAQAQQPTPPSFDMSKAVGIYGGADAPLNKYIPQMTEATKKYKFWENNPELLALIPHLETSSGRNITRPNNLTNWGISHPGNNEIFAQMTQEQVLERFISGLGERSPIYKKFRTGKTLTDEELMQFAKTYEPANESYGPNLVEGRKNIRQQLNLTQ